MTAYKLPGILRWFEVVHMSQVSPRAFGHILSLLQAGHSWPQEGDGRGAL